MNILRRLLVGISAIVFLLTLIAALIVTPPVSILTNRNNIKHWVKDTGTYDTVVATVLEAAGKSSNNTPPPEEQKDEGPDFTDPGFQDAIKKSISPAFLQQTFERIVDSSYDWMEGKTKKPEITLDLGQFKKDFGTNLGAYLTKRMNSLPICTAQQMRAMNGDVDPFKTTCRPKDYNVEQKSAQFTSDFINNKDFLPKTTLSAEDIKIRERFKGEVIETSLFDILARVKAPERFQSGKTALFVLWGIVAATALVIIAASHNRRRGISFVGWALLVLGIFQALISLLSSTAFNMITQKMQSNPDGNQNAITTKLVQPIIKSVLGTYSSTLITIGAAIGITGAALIMVSFILKRRRTAVKEEASAPAQAQPKESIEKPAEAATTAQATPEKPKQATAKKI